MAKTVSAPALSSASLPPRVYQSRHVVESESAGFSSPHISKHSASSPDGHTSIKRERSPVQSALSTVSRSSPPALIASAMVSEPPSTSVSVCITNDSSHGESSKQEPKAMQIDTDNEEPNKEQGDEEDEGEDEVMSEGVVHVNATLAPVSMSSQGKTRGTHQFTHSSPPVLPTISTSVSSLNQHADLDSPKTPTTPRTPRTPKQTKAPKSSKTTRMPKRSQSDYQGASGSRGGKSSLRDSLGDYFFSLFPPSASPATSPSSPFSFQAQLQMLTHNFVSVQPHADPCSPFRRAPTLISNATATPPFSPPASPNVDLIRDSLFHTGQSTLVGTDVPGIPPSTSSSTSSNPGSNVVSSSSTLPVSKPATSSRSHFKPRWHTQPYMMFLALRAMPDRTAARQELIMAAVELDKKFSAEKGLPRVFTGKTPMNSASACLTNNGDKYFIPFKPEGSRSTHFRLAYQPGDFDSVKKEYDAWMEQLIQQDWLQCFGTPKEGAIPLPRPNKTECRSLFEEQSRETALPRPEIQRAYSSPESRKRGADPEEEEQELDPGNIKKVKAESKAKVIEPSYGVANPQQQQQQQETAESQEDRKVADHLQRLDIKAITTQDGSLSLPPTPTVLTAADPSSSGIVTGPTKSSKESQSIHGYRLEDLDLEDVPKSLSDVVRVDISTTPNGGKGLFAQRDLPAGTPLGFYFGVPMTENEFDSLKDGVGQAQQYSVMYRRTVLDATDEQGQPYTDPEGKMYCPFHFMNEDPEGNVSFIAGSVVNQVICTSNQDIKTGEELLVFYSKEMDRGLSSAGGGHAQEGTSHGHSDNAEGKRSKVPRSRASSPTKRTTPAEDSGRPRRETVYKPVRYTR
ncbi:hypothetical protein EDD11_003792 [Mortierella claussenii]|nr:hypothetical protein EDD11_003792 [Mortierella claussenii]